MYLEGGEDVGGVAEGLEEWVLAQRRCAGHGGCDGLGEGGGNGVEEVGLYFGGWAEVAAVDVAECCGDDVGGDGDGRFRWVGCVLGLGEWRRGETTSRGTALRGTALRGGLSGAVVELVDYQSKAAPRSRGARTKKSWRRFLRVCSSTRMLEFAVRLVCFGSGKVNSPHGC